MMKKKIILTILLAAFMLGGACPLFAACEGKAPIQEEAEEEDLTLIPQEETVKYSDFGAKGDGVTDDFQAICDTHKYANENHIAVAADRDATYYIGGAEDSKKTHEKSAIIKTNTYWQNAKFIIDDRNITKGAIFYKPVFAVESDAASQQVTLPEGYSLSVGAKSVGLTFDDTKLLYLVNNTHKDFIRHGADQNNGYDRQEIILVDRNGNIDASTPVTFDYEKVTSMTAISATDTPITLSGGTFTTIANDRKTDYFWRNIEVRRSNTTVRKVVHLMEYRELFDTRRASYAGFLAVLKTTNVLFEDCKVTGIDINSAYELNAKLSNNVTWKNVSQTNGFSGNGIFGSNYCRNLKMENCVLNRFDAHMGVYNATLKDSTFGYGGISVTGFGTLYCDNVTRISVSEEEKAESGTRFIYLRDDYGSFWDGEIVIKNSKFTTNAEFIYFVYGAWFDWDFGYSCKMPNLTVENMTIDYTGTMQKKYAKEKYHMAFNRYMNVPMEDYIKSKNYTSPPTYIHLKNISQQYVLSNNNRGFYDNTEFTQE